MRKFLLPVIIVALAGASFVGSYLIFRASPEQAEAAGAPSEPSEPVNPVLAGLESAGPVGIGGEHVRQLQGLVQELRAKLEAVKQREKDLDRLERQTRLAGEDLARQAKELDALRVELNVPLARLKEARRELQAQRVLIAAREQKNLKKTAGIYGTMDTVAASRILSGMVENGQIDDAVKILYLMNERSAGRVLAEMSDADVATELTVRLKHVASEAKD